jgi:uncharacterized delta-60 repeat protein
VVRERALIRTLLMLSCTLAIVALSMGPTGAITSGTKVRARDYPFMASIQHKLDGRFWAHYCGGTLISPRLVLTAAHCFGGWDDKGNLPQPGVDSRRVTFGQDAPLEGLRIAQIRKHPTLDVALVALAATTTQQYVPMMTKKVKKGTLARMLGYAGEQDCSGRDDAGNLCRPHELDSADVEVGKKCAPEECDDKYHLITQSLDSAQGLKEGDSGGPLLVDHDRRWQLAGVLVGQKGSRSQVVRTSAIAGWVGSYNPPPSSPLKILTTRLPTGTTEAAYSATLEANGGTLPYTWSVISGSLPSGLSLNDGQLVGTPHQFGSFSLTVQVADGNGNTATASLTLVIKSRLVINTQVLPSGVVGQPYDATLSAGHGVEPYAWSIVYGTLPPGLVLSSAGAISGSPTQAGLFDPTFQVVDAAGAAATSTLVVSICLHACHSSGVLDADFGNHGTVITSFGDNDSQAEALVSQPDGKVVAAGQAWQTSQYEDGDFALARYISGGSLDATFGSGGRVTTDFGGNDQIKALARQGDGKLVAAGIADRGGDQADADFALARYDPDGTLDPSFAGGKVVTEFGGSDGARALIIQPDGKIVAAGYGGSASKFAVVRYNPDGTLDPTFGSGGKVTTSFSSAVAGATALAIQPDGKLVAAGYNADDFALARYHPNGTLDQTFGSGGKVTSDFSSSRDSIFALIIQPDGKLAVAGMTQAMGSSVADFALARYNPDGTLDTSFGSGGKVVSDLTPYTWDAASALVLEADGKLVAAGNSSGGFALARYNRDGDLDTSFGAGGKVITYVNPGYFSIALGLVAQSDGGLVAAGYTQASDFQTHFALARYWG